ncbi:unnamed protein product [Urochloa humidicola]
MVYKHAAAAVHQVQAIATAYCWCHARDITSPSLSPLCRGDARIATKPKKGPAQKWKLEEYASYFDKNSWSYTELASSVSADQESGITGLHNQIEAGSKPTRETNLLMRIPKADSKKVKTRHYNKTEALSMTDWLKQMYQLEEELKTPQEQSELDVATEASWSSASPVSV